MISSSVVWANLPSTGKPFVVSHREKFEGCIVGDESVLIIYDKWHRGGGK